MTDPSRQRAQQDGAGQGPTPILALMQDVTRLVLVYGGPSAEHDVSCVSTLHVARAVDRERFDVRIVGVSHEFGWVDVSKLAEALPADAQALPSPDNLHGLDRLPRPLLDVLADHEFESVVFPLIHGTMGEDGTLQGMLEASGVAYVGAGVLASAVCMEKHITKSILRDAEIPQGEFRVVRAADVTVGSIEHIGRELGYPCFVKPSGQGSSVGVAKVDSGDGLAKALRTAFEFGDVALVEAFIEGREIELAVMGNAEPRCTAPGEIVPSQDFYDYEDKYTLGEAELRIPAPLSDEVVAEAQALALRTYRLLEVEGFARVDMFLGGDGSLYVNEVNTIPGFTPISMFPKLWDYEGVAYDQLINQLVEYARSRHDRRGGFRRSRE